MRGLSRSDGAKKRDHVRGDGARIFARYGSLLPLLAAIATGCATQDDGALPGGGGVDTGGTNASGSAGAGTSGNTTGGTSAGTGNVSGSASGGTATAGSGGNAQSGSAGMSTSGSGGASGGTGGGSGGASGGSGGANGGKGGAGGSGGVSGGSGGKGGSGGTGGSAGAGGKAGSGGTGGSGGMSGAGGSGGTPGCTLVTDCPNDDNTIHNVCDAGKCRARGCNATNCAYELTRFIIGAATAASARGQVFLSWDATNFKLDFQIDDKTAQNDSPENWKDDSVEIYLDLNNSKMATYDADDFQINVPRDAGALQSIGNGLNLGAITVVRTENAVGYELKVTLPWSALNGAGSQLGKTIGFSIGLNDDNNGADRDTQVMLFGGDQNFNNTTGFGNLNLN
jgi:Carbohydrate family 9 binding domain-like